MQAEGGTCTSCYGQGELVTEQGPVACPDCYGEPNLKGRAELVEWRLRDLERRKLANVNHQRPQKSILIGGDSKSDTQPLDKARCVGSREHPGRFLGSRSRERAPVELRHWPACAAPRANHTRKD